MTQHLYQRHGIATALVPADADSEALMRKLKPGQYVKAEVKRVRSPEQLRLWWAFMSAVAQAIGTTKEAVSDYALVNTGYVEVHKMGRHTYQRPKSIALGNMGQDEFNAAFDAARLFVLSEVAPHLKPGDAARIVGMAA